MDATAQKTDLPQADNPMMTPPVKEHEWLHQLVGDWTYEGECSMGPDQPRASFTGTETVRLIGDRWTVAEGQGEMPDGSGTATMIQTLGYDPAKGRYVGSWIGSMMSHLWSYEGHVDGTTLTLESEGPNCMGEGMARFRDVIDVSAPDRRTLTAYIQGEDGQWQEMMQARYRRRI